MPGGEGRGGRYFCFPIKSNFWVNKCYVVCSMYFLTIKVKQGSIKYWQGLKTITFHRYILLEHKLVEEVVVQNELLQE